MLEPFSISALGVFVATSCLAFSGFIAAVCKGTQHSRCSHINACCMSCDRDVINENGNDDDDIEMKPIPIEDKK